MASGSSDLSMYWEWGRWPPQRNRSSHYQEIHRTPTIDILADLVFMTISRDCEVYVKCFSELASHEDKLSRKMLLCWIATCSAVRQNKGHGMGLRLSQDHLGFCWHWVLNFRIRVNYNTQFISTKEWKSDYFREGTFLVPRVLCIYNQSMLLAVHNNASNVLCTSS
jgi:hypothetical protein